MVKSGSVETFNWEYTDKKVVNNRRTKQDVTKKVLDIQAILINPKWAEHGYDTFGSTEATASQDSDEGDGGRR